MGMHASHVWACVHPMYGHACVSCMGMRVSCVWACVCPMYGHACVPCMGMHVSRSCLDITGHSVIVSSLSPLYGSWGLRTAPGFICLSFCGIAVWLASLHDLSVGLVTSGIYHCDQGSWMASKLICVGFWQTPWFCTIPLGSPFTTHSVCSSGGLWMRENRSRAPLRITSNSERLVHSRLWGVAQSRAEQRMRRCFPFTVGRLRGLEIQCFPFKLWQHILEKQKKIILNSRATKR